MSFIPIARRERVYFISNHDQMNPEESRFAFRGDEEYGVRRARLELIFHGRMLPVSLLDSRNCVLKNFSIDFKHPQISQVKVVENDTLKGGITFEVAPWVRYEIRDSVFVAKGEGWELTPGSGIAFEGDTRHLVYNTSDIPVGVRGLIEVSPRLIKTLPLERQPFGARHGDRHAFLGTSGSPVSSCIMT